MHCSGLSGTAGDVTRLAMKTGNAEKKCSLEVSSLSKKKV